MPFFLRWRSGPPHQFRVPCSRCVLPSPAKPFLPTLPSTEALLQEASGLAADFSGPVVPFATALEAVASVIRNLAQIKGGWNPKVLRRPAAPDSFSLVLNLVPAGLATEFCLTIRVHPNSL